MQGYEKDGKLRPPQDCVLFLQARKLGLMVLTANVKDYDVLLQPGPRRSNHRREGGGVC